MLIEMISVNPVPLFQIFVALQYPSLISICLTLIAVLVSHFAINCVIMYNLGTDTLKITDGCLAKGATGKTIPLHSILNDRFPFEYSIYNDIEHWLFQMNGLLNKRSLDEMIYLHYAPGQRLCKAYTRSHLFSSHIFISHLPEKDEAIPKFLFLHELFHVFGYVLARPTTISISIPSHLTLVVWSVYFMKWTSAGLASLSMLALLLFIWNERSRWESQRTQVISELLADALALGYMTTEELKLLRSCKAIDRLKDPNFSKTENRFRIASLKAHIDVALAGKKDLIDELKEEEIELRTPPAILITFILSVFFCSTNVNQPLVDDLINMSIFAVLLLLFFLLALFRYMHFSSKLSHALDQSFPTDHLD